jgi:phosphomannomutase
MGAMALILQYITERDEPLSQLMNTIPQYKIIKETLRMDSRKKQQRFVERVKEDNRGKKMDERDGVRIEEKDRWVHVRMSGTEPVVRIIAEAPTIKGATSLCKMIKEQERY